MFYAKNVNELKKQINQIENSLDLIKKTADAPTVRAIQLMTIERKIDRIIGYLEGREQKK